MRERPIFILTLYVGKTGGWRAVPFKNLCHPRHHKRGDRVSGGVERSETVRKTVEAGGRCPSRTCATLGTIRGGTASAVGSSEARRF